MEAKANNLPFLTSLNYMQRRFGINMSEDDFIESAYYIWREIGNIAKTVKQFVVTVPVDGIIELPDDAESITSVVAASLKGSHNNFGSELRGNTSSAGRQREYEPAMGAFSSGENARVSEYYNYGESVNYTTGQGFIKITSQIMSGVPVRILYNVIEKDDMGLPLLNDREVEAIGTNMALRETEKRLFRGEKGAAEFMNYIRPEAERALQAAGIPEKISDDEIDKLLDVISSSDRKTFGDRFNSIK